MTERKAVKSKILRITAVVLMAVILLSIGALALTKFIYDAIFPRYERSDLETALNISYAQIEDTYPRERVEFYSGENKLTGYIYGEKNSQGLVVVTPGLSDGAEDYTSVVLGFVDEGFRVFIFDTTGSFESQGENSVGFAQAAIDLDNALKYIEADKELKSLPLFLFGHSRGGYASALMSAYKHDIKAITTVGGVNSSMEITTEWAKNYVGAIAYTGYPALYAYQAMIFGNELLSLTAADAIDCSDIPTLIIHAENDTTVTVDGSSIYAHKNEIENPNAEFMLYTDASNSGHSTLLFTKEANDYRDDVKDEYSSLYESYGGEIPSDLENKFYENIDAQKAQQPNKELITLISDYYKNHI